MPSFDKKGFTFVELIIALALVALLSTVALQSYFSSSENFGFLAQYRELIAIFRDLRSDAINNRQISVISEDVEGNVSVLPNYYGVYLSANCVATFADTGQQELAFDMPDSLCEKSGYAAEDDKIIKSISLKRDGLALEAFSGRSQDSPLSLPVIAYYRSGSGDLNLFESTAQGDQQLLAKSTEKFISMRLYQVDNPTNQKYLVLYQVSGLAEELNQAEFNEIYGVN